MAQIKVLEEQNSRLMEFESENQRLRKLLQFRDDSGRDRVVASVIGRDPSNWLKTITINRGADYGIKPGFAVVDGKRDCRPDHSGNRAYCKSAAAH